MTEIEIAIRGDEWASTKTADRGGYYFAGLSEGYYNGYLEATEELQKENAELKEKVNILDNCDRLGDVITEAYKEQLTKAKEIIKKIEKIFYSGENAIKRLSEISDILAEAEQFISEAEK